MLSCMQKRHQQREKDASSTCIFELEVLQLRPHLACAVSRVETPTVKFSNLLIHETALHNVRVPALTCSRVVVDGRTKPALRERVHEVMRKLNLQTEHRQKKMKTNIGFMKHAFTSEQYFVVIINKSCRKYRL